MALPEREHLPHQPPPWVRPGECFFITVCATPRGVNHPATASAGRAILDSVAHYHAQGTWWVHLFLIMPAHVHALLSVAPDRSMTNTMRAWKSWQTKMVGVTWQPGFFDHRLRSDESFDEKAHYIRQNPDRAGLIARAEDWPHVWVPSR